jgi:hypothetical protein
MIAAPDSLRDLDLTVLDDWDAGSHPAPADVARGLLAHRRALREF